MYDLYICEHDAALRSAACETADALGQLLTSADQTMQCC